MILKLFSILLILGSGRASGSNLGACRTNGAPLSSGYRYQHFHGVSNEVHPAPDLFDELPPICALPRRASIEYCVFTSTKFAGGRGISVLARREHTDNILNLPAFRNPEIYSAMGINQNSNAGFHARELKGRGIGLVANRTIKQGEWLMSFTPAFMMSYEAYDDLSEKERIYFQRLAFERLPDRVRGLAYQLYGQSEEKAIDSIDDILDTNTFDLPVDLTSWSQGIEDNDGQADEEEEDEDDENDEEVNFKFLFPEIAVSSFYLTPSSIPHHGLFAPRGSHTLLTRILVLAFQPRLPTKRGLLLRFFSPDSTHRCTPQHISRRRAHNYLHRSSPKTPRPPESTPQILGLHMRLFHLRCPFRSHQSIRCPYRENSRDPG